MVSTSAVAARDNTNSNPEVDGEGVPIYLVNGELVGFDYASLWRHELGPSMHVTELGEFFPFEESAEFLGGGVAVWTGFFSKGIIDPDGWMGDLRPSVGEATKGGTIAFGTASSLAEFHHHLFGMSAVLTVPEPEVSTCWLVLSVVFFLRQHNHERLRTMRLGTV